MIKIKTDKVFTIEVEKKVEDDGEIKNIDDLNLFHGECYNGKIEVAEISEGRVYESQEESSSYLALACIKCKMRVWVCLFYDPYMKIFKTALDSKKRKIDKSEDSTSGYYDRVLKGYDVNNMFSGYPYNNIHVYVVKKGFKELHCPYCGGQLMQKGTYCPFCGVNVGERIKEIKEVIIKK